MELNTLVNQFVGSNYFPVLIIALGIGVGFLLRSTFRSSDSEYVHKSDE